MYSFEDFSRDVKSRVRLLNRRLERADATWPGVLILDCPNGLSADAFELSDDPAARDELVSVLTQEIRRSYARRFCWVMPVWRGDPLRESLLLAIGERNRVEVALADIYRSPTRPPRLAPWVEAEVPDEALITSRFVDQLIEALWR